jgi:hypothetical protein
MMRGVIDHLVYATPDLADTVDELQRSHGLGLTPGGAHLGSGTRNHLADLGGGGYLEVIGPDPAQPDPDGPRPFGVDRLTAPRLLTWAARVSDLDATVAAARRLGYDPGPGRAMSRTRVDGTVLQWRLTAPPDGSDRYGGVVPFLIEWGDTEHPSRTAARGARLVWLTAEHPDPEAVGERLTALGVGADLVVGAGARPLLRAVLVTEAGELELV